MVIPRHARHDAPRGCTTCRAGESREALVLLNTYERVIDEQLASGRPFEEIEQLIDATPLTSEQQAALWLLAWSYQERRVQNRVAREALAAVS
jgi:hypothetical protein